MFDKIFEDSDVNRAVLVGLYVPSLPDSENSDERSMEELEALLETAGGTAVGTVLQKKSAPDAATLIGSGKVEEIREMTSALSADMVVFDNELTPSQQKTLTDKLGGIRVIDRTALILDIFAQRAKSKEGVLQVELAQYQYLLPRLSGMWKHLVRQNASGGKSPIGTRGPGETQLETDRRLIHKRIEKLRRDLDDVEKVHRNGRRRREKNAVPVLALIGYTNAGKTTLLNALSGENVPANNRLFDTLDTLTRTITLSPGSYALLSDTVGFIAKLPHQLVDAFKSTLDELRYADVLLHVIDVSDPEVTAHYAVVQNLLEELGVMNIPRIDILNKSDLGVNAEFKPCQNSVCISAKTGQGLEELRRLILKTISLQAVHLHIRLDYREGDLLHKLYREAKVERVVYGDAVFVDLTCDAAYAEKLKSRVQNG